MMLPIALVIVIAVFALQLKLCFGAKRIWVKLLPVILIAVAEAGCGIVYMISLYLDHMGKGIYGAAFAAVIYSVVLLIILTGDALAWGIYGIVKLVQKRRK